MPAAVFLTLISISDVNLKPKYKELLSKCVFLLFPNLDCPKTNVNYKLDKSQMLLFIYLFAFFVRPFLSIKICVLKR